MYLNEDLNSAVKSGIFTQDSVDKFRDFIEQQKATEVQDSENFRLIRGFNDIFISIVISVLLISLLIFSNGFSILLILASWILAEIFVKKRKLALPAVILTIAFMGSTFGAVYWIFAQFDTSTYKPIMPIASFAITSMLTWFFWKRFTVPITVGLSVASIAGLVISILVYLFPLLKSYLDIFILLTGIILFFIAMRWDSQDIYRRTYKSDVAFWIHLIASPLIVHSIFNALGIFDSKDPSLLIISAIVGIFIILSLVSLIVDRKVFMLSSLLYVQYAIGHLFKKFSGSSSFSFAGIVITLLLITITLYWRDIRYYIISKLPIYIQKRVPKMLS